VRPRVFLWSIVAQLATHILACGMASDIALVALHRYYTWAKRLRQLFEDSLRKEPADVNSVVWFATSETFMFMSYFYAALYVVLEGWIDLGLITSTRDSWNSWIRRAVSPG
jgi:hypothetical protein